mmetsp:Transcript_8805/g.27851  ORF Transcript_8805/g.27851 Transcript_8805/m.27851 type:complete len:268 (+) Transcript_8805:337-1140(+)
MGVDVDRRERLLRQRPRVRERSILDLGRVVSGRVLRGAVLRRLQRRREARPRQAALVDEHDARRRAADDGGLRAAGGCGRHRRGRRDARGRGRPARDADVHVDVAAPLCRLPAPAPERRPLPARTFRPARSPREHAPHPPRRPAREGRRPGQGAPRRARLGLRRLLPRRLRPQARLRHLPARHAPPALRLPRRPGARRPQRSRRAATSLPHLRRDGPRLRPLHRRPPPVLPARLPHRHAPQVLRHLSRLREGPRRAQPRPLLRRQEA